MAWMAGLLLGGLAAVVALGQNASVRIEPGEAGVPVLNLSRLADWVDEQWEFYNRITPPWKELVQPLWMEALPVDPEEFPTSFVEQLEGEWEGSIAIYPLSIAQDPDTRETSLYNLSGEPVAVWFGEEAAWPEGMDPSRITFTLDLLDQADEPAYALARRSEASAKLARRAPMTLSTPSASSGLSFLPMELLSNGVVRLTLIHASAPVQIFAYSASPQGSNPRFQGMDGTWSVWGEPLGATNGVAVGEGSLMGPGDSHRFFAAALVQDSDGDGLTDGMELFVHHTDPAQMQDSDGDGLPDGMELLVHHTDPARADTDGDGIPDGVELRRESNPSDFLSRPMPDLVLSAEDADYSWLIQQAVSSNSNADTIIHLSGGLYQVDGGDILELQGTNLVVLGSSDPLNPTILDGRYAGRCIRVQGKNIHLVDLVFRNGAGSPIALGGGLAAYAVDGLILNRCRFEACVSDAGMGGGIQPLSAPAPYGGALYAQGGDVTLINCAIWKSKGGAALAFDPYAGGQLSLLHCTLADNEGGLSGGTFGALSVDSSILFSSGTTPIHWPGPKSITHTYAEMDLSDWGEGNTTRSPALFHSWRLGATPPAEFHAPRRIGGDIDGEPRAPQAHIGADEWVDGDGDGMPDWWEMAYGLDLLANDSLDDLDQDGLPHVYEQFNNGNPTNSDAASVVFLRVDPAASGPNVFATLDEAFDASEAYSIIEVADGIYSGSGINTYLWFPEHPVMLCSDNIGSSRQTVFTYGDEGAAFYFNAQQDNHTIVRGITLRMSGSGSYQYGFWLGPGIYFGQAGAAPIFDGVTVETGESGNNIAFMCYGPTPEPIIFNNCIFRGKPGKSVPLRGIYAMDSSALQLINCSFLNFPSAPYAYGVQLHSRYLEETGVVKMANCLWDSSFTASSPTPPFVRYLQSTNSAPYVVQIADSIMPAMPTWFPPDTHTNLYIAHALVAMGGHLQTNSPGIDAGGPTWTLADFEGQPRDAAPDIGADEYAPFGAGDADGDGLGDASEIETYGTDPYHADSDSDTILDATEVAEGTDPTDPWSYRFELLGMVTNQSDNSSAVWICPRWSVGGWDTNTATMATNGNFALSIMSSGQTNILNVGAFCDYNTNGLPDAIEPIYWKTVAVTGSLTRTSFLLKDYDGDFLSDGQEVLCGTDPLSSNNYCVSVSGCLTNVYIDTGNFYVGLSLTTNAENMVVVTNVAADGTFAFSHIIMTNSSSDLRLMHFDDVNTNGMWDANELYGYGSTNRTRVGHTFYWVQEARDYDNDYMQDFWEVRQNFNWTNQLDCMGDADSDGFYNVLEYWMKTDPYSANNSSNTAILNAIAAVDEKLVGRTPSTAWTIFSLRNHAATNYVRNTNCWAYSYDLTCNSPWNSTRHVYYTSTLISPRHVLFAAHWDLVTNGTVLRFVDQQNNVIERTLVAKIRHPLYNHSDYPDLSVGLLDSDVPTNQIAFAHVLPDNYTNYLSRGTRLPALALNQFHKATVCDIMDISWRKPNGRIYTQIHWPIDITRKEFYTGLEGGDSGYPLFVFLSGKTVLLTVWSSAYFGTSVTAFKEDINEMMTALGGGYQLTEINLSEFRALDE